MSSIQEKIKQKPALGWALFFTTVVVVFLLGILASSIMERRAEAVFAYSKKVDHDQFEPRNAIWGKNFPKEYQSYMQTAEDDFQSKYNGNTMIDMLEVDPRLVVLWAGYGFSKDYKQGRGHYYAIEDIQAVAQGILRHRIVKNYKAEAEGITEKQIIEALKIDNPDNSIMLPSGYFSVTLVLGLFSSQIFIVSNNLSNAFVAIPVATRVLNIVINSAFSPSALS